MIFQIIIEPIGATFLFFFIPVLMIIPTIILHVIHMKLKESRAKLALRWLVDPLPIKPFFQKRKKVMQSEGKIQRDPKQKAKYGFVQFFNRFFFLLMFAGLFVLGSLLGLVFHECGHGFINVMHGGEWYRITILDPFRGTCSGTLYLTGDPYYIARSWVLLGGALTQGIVGGVLLISLFIPQVRKSFWASLVVLMTSIVSISSGLHNWFGTAWLVHNGYPGLDSDTTGFLWYQSQLPNGLTAMDIITTTTFLMIGTVVVFILAGSKLWRIHYPDHRFSHIWFVGLGLAVWIVHFLIKVNFFMIL